MQLRVSAHGLEIESGRYKKKSESESLCKSCNLNTIEDEVHFLCNCSAYKNARQYFLGRLHEVHRAIVVTPVVHVPVLMRVTLAV